MKESIHYHYLIGYVPEPHTEKYHVVKQVFVHQELFRNDTMVLNLKSFKALLGTMVESNTDVNTGAGKVSYEMIANWELNQNRLWQYESLQLYLGETCGNASGGEDICRRIMAK